MNGYLIVAMIGFLAISTSTECGAQSSSPGKLKTFTIVIHGGAGTISPSMPESVKAAYYQSLYDALSLGKVMLAKGEHGIDVVERVLNYFENDPKFNAGIGAVFTSDGEHEMDASIMNGRDLSSGAVAGVKHITHPISLARLVMEKTAHVLLAGEGAEKFAADMGMTLVPTTYFDTPERYNQWQEYKKKLEEGKKGTVGCVVLDQFGDLAAGTSTGGMTNKMPGRIGDSPLINAGTYANNKTCAVSCTGWGEKFITNTVAFNISALMEYKKLSLHEAVNEMIYKRLGNNDGGLIAVDRDGNFAMEFNTLGMFRGVANSSGTFEVKIWK
ncbi:MAG: isoaspartyl peptidase/L-asparaginase [Bacteroidota bacterium]|jgi:beta-aspartyl-peptidase (threonine type)